MKPPIFLTSVICLLGMSSWAATQPNNTDNATNKEKKASVGTDNKAKTSKADNSITVTGPQ